MYFYTEKLCAKRKRVRFLFTIIFALCAQNCFVAVAQSDAGKLRSNITAAVTNEQRVNAYRQMIRYFQYTNNDSAIFYAQQALARFTADKYDGGRAAMLHSLGNIYDNEGLFEAAKQKEEEALKIFTAIGNKSGIANVQNALGVYQGRKGNYKEAIDIFVNSLSAFESTKDTAGIISTYIKLGAANTFSMNYSKALEYYNAALRLSAHSGNPDNLIFLNTNIGAVYCRMGDFDKGIAYAQKALDLSTAPELAHVRIEPLTNLGKIYHERGDDKKALEYYNQALRIAQDDKQSEDYIRVLLHTTMITGKSDPVKATADLNDALKITRASGQKTLEAEIMEGMIELNCAVNNYKQAFEWQVKKETLLDSIYDINKAKEIAGIQAVHDLSRSNEQLTQLRESELRNKKKKDVIIVIAIFLAGSVIAMLYLYRNSRILNSRLNKRTNELKNANDVKDKVFSIIGHDLNSAIMNMPSLLELYRHESTSDAEKAMIIDSLEETAVVSAEILENLLSWGKSQIKGITLHQTLCDAREIIDTKIRLLRIASRNKNITITNNVPTGTMAFVDANHFTFIIRNLLSNAIKYSPDGGNITVSASTVKMPGFVTFCVKDNGIGITAEQQKNIFEPFNVSAPGTADEAGNSIGLLLCKEFVTANGGKIWVDSAPGQGATFCFSLKLTA